MFNISNEGSTRIFNLNTKCSPNWAIIRHDYVRHISQFVKSDGRKPVRYSRTGPTGMTNGAILWLDRQHHSAHLLSASWR